MSNLRVYKRPYNPYDEEDAFDESNVEDMANYTGTSPDVKSLINIVAGLQKDIKKINDCITVDGARRWIDKNNKEGWSAHETDIIGPNGRPDGINEVFVRDAKDNIRIVNGYGLSKSQYPERKAYYTHYPDREDRIAFNQRNKEAGRPTGLNGYKQMLNAIEFDGEHPPQYRYTYDSDLGKKPRTQPTEKATFIDYMFRPFYEAHKETIKGMLEEAGYTNGTGLGQFYLQASNEVWKQAVINPILEQMGVDLGAEEKELRKAMNKVRKTDEYKGSIVERLKELCNMLYTGNVDANGNLVIETDNSNQFFNEFIDSAFGYVITEMERKLQEKQSFVPTSYKSYDHQSSPRKGKIVNKQAMSPTKFIDQSKPLSPNKSTSPQRGGWEQVISQQTLDSLKA